MRFLKKIIFLLCLGTLLLFAEGACAQDGTQKCNCTPKTLEARRNDADAVFLGTVKNIEVVEKFVQYGTDDLPVTVTFLVDDGYKGAETGKTFTLHTSLTRETCTGHPFVKWKKYLVFAYARKEETYETWSLYNFPSGTFDVGGLCGGTKLITDPRAAQDVKILQNRAAPARKGGVLRRLFND